MMARFWKLAYNDNLLGTESQASVSYELVINNIFLLRLHVLRQGVNE